jgi:hypothetical protein
MTADERHLWMNADHAGPGTVSASNVRLDEGKEIDVTMTGSFAMKTAANANYSLAYTVAAGTNETSVSSGGVVATFQTSTSTQSQTVYFTAGTPAYAGTFSDTVTLAIAVK